MQPNSDPAEERATARAEEVALAWELKDPGQGDRYVARTPQGEVALEALVKVDAQDISYLEVWVGGQTVDQEPHFRVVNPPLLARDPEGDVKVRGQGYREDPLAALAEAVAAHGGANPTRRRTR